MAIEQDMTRGFYVYISDDTNDYNIGTTNQNGATVNGATATTPGSNPGLPPGWKPRHIYGKNVATGLRTSVPILDPTNTLWTGNGGTFSKNSTEYQIEGKIGEKRVYRGG